MSVRVDPGRIGMSLVELKSAVVDLQADEQTEDAIKRADAGLTRFIRKAEGVLAEVEYELWRGHVYRIRWKLDARFERPVLDDFARRARVCFGRPDYDQKFEAEPSSSKVTLRQVGWTHGERRVELRQLHPLRGGAVYLTVSKNAALRDIVSSRVALYPEPDTTGPWWQRSMEPPKPPTDDERQNLGDAFVGLVSQLDH